jgi:predicted DNA-binding protein (MmcQ/YjbR family)
MDIEQLRAFCLSFPGATEHVQWGDDLVFKVGGKIFAVAPLEPARLWLCLKAHPEDFAELTERPGIFPAPYLARAKWIAIESAQTIPPSEVTALLCKSYDLIAAKLSRAARASLTRAKPDPRKKPSKRVARKRRKKPFVRR